MIRSRTSQLLKIEKENENKDIKKKQKNIQAKVYSSTTTNTTERVGLLTENQSKKYIGVRSGGGTNEFQTSIHKTHKSRVESSDTYVKSIGVFPNHKKPGSYMAPTPGPKPSLGPKQTKRQPKMITLPELDEKEQEVKEMQLLSNPKKAEVSVMEILTPRNTLCLKDSSSETKNTCDQPLSPDLPSRKSRTSDSTTERSQPEKFSSFSDSSTYLNLDLDLCSLNSLDGENETFYMAPLIPVPSGNSSSNSSATLERKFRDVLDDRRNPMAKGDIKAVKDILKTDERHSLLKTSEADPQLFKDILKTQLEEIIRNERAVKLALKKLGATPRLTSGRSLEVLEIAELLSLHKKRVYERHAKRKPKRKQTGIRTDVLDEDTSPRQKTHYDIVELVTSSDTSSDNQSPQVISARLENCYELSEKGLKNSKREKRARSADPKKEYAEFVKSTLPQKQKVSIKKLENQTAIVECPSQVDIKLHIKDDHSEEGELRLKQKHARKPQVDVTFKNVPSLEKEILILRALGEQLEATLKRTVSEPSLSETDKERGLNAVSSIMSLTKELKKIDSSIEVYPGRCSEVGLTSKFLIMNKVLWTQEVAGCLTYPRGLRHEVGVVNEFMMVSKTLDELKCDANSNFYIPKSGRLECTSFAKLKTEPQFLLQNIKPKTVGQPFNFLDHDPIFLNSFLLPALTYETVASPKLETSSKDSGLTETVAICEGGDSLTAAVEGLKKSTIISEPKISIKNKEFVVKATTNQTKQPQSEEKTVISTRTSQESSKSIKTIQSCRPPITRRSRIRRNVTPMPFDAFDEPKNTLLRKILIGTVQLSVFLGLIVALTFPDIKC